MNQNLLRSGFRFSSNQSSTLAKPRRAFRALGEGGMTLIEIMIVLVILGGLMATLGKTIFGNLRKAEVGQTRIQFKEVSKQLEMYSADCGGYPSTEQGLQALLQDPGKDVCSNWGPEAYLKDMPKDAWKKPLIYESDGSTFVLRSLGQDRKPGGSGVAADISSSDPE